MYTILTDPLLRQLSLPTVTFADDVNFLADVTELSKDDVQAELDIIANWSEEFYMPLSVDKNITMHGGHRQPMHECSIHRTTINSVVSFKDLGVLRSAVGYSSHCDNLVAKASQVDGAIRRAFYYKSSELMRPASQLYVIPKIMYLSQAWNPWLKCEINALEKLQRRYTKTIHKLRCLSYKERLRRLNALSLTNRKLYVDMTFIYNCLHGHVNFPAADMGLRLKSTITRANGLELEQICLSNNTFANLFRCRAVLQWNKLSVHIVSAKSITVFKRLLHNYLFNLQYSDSDYYYRLFIGMCLFFFLVYACGGTFKRS